MKINYNYLDYTSVNDFLIMIIPQLRSDITAIIQQNIHNVNELNIRNYQRKFTSFETMEISFTNDIYNSEASKNANHHASQFSSKMRKEKMITNMTVIHIDIKNKIVDIWLFYIKH